MNNLTLIGTIHMDFAGPKRLEKLLSYLKPEAIAVEYGKSRVVDVDSYEKIIRDPQSFSNLIDNFIEKFPDANPSTIAEYLKIADYEFRVTRDYCNKYNKLLLLADDIDSDELVEKLLDKSSLLYKKMNEILCNSVNQLNSKVEKMYSGDIPGLTDEELNEFNEYNKITNRDKRTAKGIRTISADNTAYVGGLAHIYGGHEYYRGEPNLFERLKDLNPKRMRLDEADVLVL